MAICTRLVTSSLVNRRDTCALTVASLMNSEAATSALEAPDPIAAATSRSRSVSAASRWAAARRRSDAWASPKWESRVRVTDGEMIASPEATSADGVDDLGGRGVLDQESAGAGAQRAHHLLVGLERGQHDHLRRRRRGGAARRSR